MTISSTTNRISFAGNDVTVAFATSPVVFFDSADLTVYDVVTATGVATTKTLTTDYTVTGGSGSTGTVTMLAAPATGHTLVIVRDVAITQGSDLVNNDASDAEVIEDAFDRLTMIAQQLDARQDRSLILADSDVSGVSTVVPTPAANSIFGWNAAGTALINYVIQAGTSLVDLAASAGSSLIGFIQAGTGAVLRTVQARLRDTVSVKDFGALGDGATDDTTALQAALTYAALNERGLFFPKGSYLVTTTLTYAWANASGTLRLYGETIGRGFSGSFLKWTGTAGGTIFKFTGANSVVFENMGCNGNDSADKLVWFENAAGAVGSSDIQLINCKFHSTRRTTKSVGVQFGSSTFQVSEVVVDRCNFSSCYYGILSFTSNVKNFRIVKSNAASCFWGFCHGDPSGSSAVGGIFQVDGCVFSSNGNTSGGFFNGVAAPVDVGGDLFQTAGTVKDCESEGSARFVNYSIGNVGSNYAHLTLIGNQFESSTNVPADDYVVQVGGGLTLIGNKFQNGRTAGAVAKIKSHAMVNRYTTATLLSQGIISKGNWYESASKYAPLYDSTDNLLTDPLNFSSNWRGAMQTFGDVGGTAGAIVALEEFTGTGSSKLASLIRANATDCTWVYSGLLAVGVNKVTIPYTALVTANTIHRETVYTIPARTKITNVMTDVTQAFAGLAGTIQMRLGDTTGTEDTYILAHDIKTAVITKGLLDADLGAQLTRATAIQGGVTYWAAASIVRARFDSSVGNFGNGTTTSLNAGSVDIYITVARMP